MTLTARDISRALDEVHGKGFAKVHPELVASYTQNAALGFDTHVGYIERHGNADDRATIARLMVSLIGLASAMQHTQASRLREAGIDPSWLNPKTKVIFVDLD